jgi:hypothetical protein
LVAFCYTKDGQGVFFVNVNDGTEVQANTLRTNEPKTITLRIPALPTGQYRIEIRNTTRKGKELRTSVYTTYLTVA